MNEPHPWELLARYGAGQVTPAEAERLAVWSAGAPERARMMERVRRLVELSRAGAAADDAAEAWQRLERRLADSASTIQVLQVRPSGPAPAALLRASRSRWGRVAALAAAVVAAAAVGLGVLQSHRGPSTAIREIATSRGQRLEFGLPDGSRVMLGPASRLRLAAAGFREARTLVLEGEGYFTVAHDPAHPFTVRAAGAAAQAVGTAFGVRAYAEDAAVQVAVVTGRVLLRPAGSAPGSGTLLVRNSVGAIDADGRIVVRRDQDLARYLGWRDGEIRFERVPLADVLRELKRAYDIHLGVSDAGMAAVPVTATFRPQTTGDIARMLADLLDMRVDSAGSRVWLRSKAQGR